MSTRSRKWRRVVASLWESRQGCSALIRRRNLLSPSPICEGLECRTLLSGPSAIGHITNGQLDIINSRREWSDVTPAVFAASHGYLYADQANLHHPAGSAPDTFMLMYDEA